MDIWETDRLYTVMLTLIKEKNQKNTPPDLLVVKLETAKLENWLPWTEDTELKPVHGIQFSELGTAMDHHIFILKDRGKNKTKEPCPPLC